MCTSRVTRGTHEANEVADRLAKETANAGIGVEVDVPRAFTRRLAKEQTWRVWAQEWRDLEHGSGMDMGEDKAYLRFAPTLEDVKEAVWKGGKAGGHRVLQLLSGHCNLAGYLHSIFDVLQRRSKPQIRLTLSHVHPRPRL